MYRFVTLLVCCALLLVAYAAVFRKLTPAKAAAWHAQARTAHTHRICLALALVLLYIAMDTYFAIDCYACVRIREHCVCIWSSADVVCSAET